MGKALLSRLRLAGVGVRAYDISEASLEAASQAGAEAVRSAAETAVGADYIHIFVRTDNEVLDAVLGADGVIKGAEAGSVLFLHSTTLPTTTSQVAEAVAQQGVEVVDAPITSVPRRVEAGDAAFLVGGSDDLIARVQPYLERLGGRIYHFGPLGAGNTAKLCKNLGNGVERIVLRETLQIAAAAGLEPLQVIEMMRAEDAGSVLSRWQGAFDIESDRVKMRKVMNIFDKDLPLAAELGRMLGLELSVIPEAAKAALKHMSEDEDKLTIGSEATLNKI
jgi:3-hydroxyisobutyrate dehydrogenase-like beta-hydroxyacid dehydrogenase